MYTLTISDNSKRRTLGYLTNDYYPGGKKDLGRIVNYKILGDDGEGFFKIGFPEYCNKCDQYIASKEDKCIFVGMPTQLINEYSQTKNES